MKKYTLKSSLLAGLAAMLLFFPSWKESSLTDITKPYLGEYECKSAMLGDSDYTEMFSYIRLELKSDETFSLYYCPKQGKKREETGKYRYDKEKNTIALRIGENGEEKEFPLKEGQISLTFRIGSKMFSMRFERK